MLRPFFSDMWSDQEKLVCCLYGVLFFPLLWSLSLSVLILLLLLLLLCILILLYRYIMLNTETTIVSIANHRCEGHRSILRFQLRYVIWLDAYMGSSGEHTLCIYIYIHSYIYICMHYIYKYIYTVIYICMHYIYIHIYIHTYYTCTYVLFSFHLSN